MNAAEIAKKIFMGTVFVSVIVGLLALLAWNDYTFKRDFYDITDQDKKIEQMQNRINELESNWKIRNSTGNK